MDNSDNVNSITHNNENKITLHHQEATSIIGAETKR